MYNKETIKNSTDFLSKLTKKSIQFRFFFCVRRQRIDLKNNINQKKTYTLTKVFDTTTKNKKQLFDLMKHDHLAFNG